MILKEIQHIFHKELDPIFGKDEVDSFFDMLLKAYLGFSRIDLVLNPNLAITKTEEQPLFEALSRLKLEEPIQYIIGNTEFYGLKVKVNTHTLIPRPETEELVDWILRDIGNQESEVNILDIGTGSGCIAVALAKNLPNAKVYAIDVSEEALSVAKENAKLNDVKIEFIHQDILSLDNADQVLSSRKFDIIVSSNAIHHLKDSRKKELYSQIFEMLNENGIFLNADEIKGESSKSYLMYLNYWNDHVINYWCS